MYKIVLLTLMLATTLWGAQKKSEYLIGVDYGQFKNVSEVDAANLHTAYAAKIGIKEGLGIAALEYNYVEEFSQDNQKLQYQSALILLDGMTKPKHFAGSLDAQMSVGLHLGVLQANIADEESRGFIYGAQGGMVFPLSKWLLFEAIYRYSLTNVTAGGIKTDAIQQLNLGASFVF